LHSLDGLVFYEEEGFFYYPYVWAIVVKGMTKNLELYQTLVGISAPRWSYSTVEIRRSAALELFFQSWSSPKHALSYNPQLISPIGKGPQLYTFRFRVENWKWTETS
jgi:hypothetical protein